VEGEDRLCNGLGVAAEGRVAREQLEKDNSNGPPINSRTWHASEKAKPRSGKFV